jgi:hypothetical protein
MRSKASLISSMRIDVKAKLGGDHDLVAERGKCLTNNLLVREGTIHFSGVKEGDAALDRRTDEGNRVFLGQGVAIAEVQSHAAEADGRDF